MKGLVKKTKAADGSAIYGVLELVEGEGFLISEYPQIPLIDHITREIDVFDENETIESVEQQYRVDLSDFELTHFGWLPVPEQ